jgi:hypothetical protein
LRRTSKKNKPFWERAYKGHAYWLGKAKLGRVTLAEKGRYYLGSRADAPAAAEDLDKAKKAVELAAAMADKQLDLFK